MAGEPPRPGVVGALPRHLGAGRVGPADLFIGSGQRPGLKNVLVIRQDGSVLRMEFDPTKIRPIAGGGTKIFTLDLSGAETLVPGG